MTILNKIKRRLWRKIVRRLRNTGLYPFLYRSYRHAFLSGKTGGLPDVSQFYLTALPNRGAGIGHQIANWIAGYHFAGFFGLKYAHSPFPNPDWEAFLGFGEGEITAQELATRGYRKVRLPLFDEKDEKQVELVKKILHSYKGKVLFQAEQDQFYEEQHGVAEKLKSKFYGARSRGADKLIFDRSYFNIAVHVRRGDIVTGQSNGNSNLQQRWQDNEYFENSLSQALGYLSGDKPAAIYLFSQGKPADFSSFHIFDNVKLCLDMDARESFLHMVNADLLITSKSSFSYKPALLNKGIKICPADFWHGYPETADFILADNEGNIRYQHLTTN